VQKTIRVQIEKGIHARTAAFISGATGNINREYSTEVFIRKGLTSVPATSMLALNYLKIKNEDEIEIVIKGDRASEAMVAMEKLFLNENNLRITDLESFDKVLDANSKRSEFIIDQMQSGVLYLNKNKVIVLVNESTERITGKSRSQLLGNTLESCFSEHERGLFDCVQNFESRKVMAFNKYLECSQKSVQIDSGTGTMITLRDVTTLVSLNNELADVRAVRERLGHVLEYLTDGVAVVDNSGVIQYVNSSFCQLFKVDTSILGTKLCDTPSSVLCSKLMPYLTDILETREFFDSKIFEIEPDKKVAVSVSGLDMDDEFTGVIGIFTELNTMRELVNKLNAAEKKVETLEKKLKMASPLHAAFKCLIGDSRALDEALRVATRVANTSATVLVTGESGTGKELFAKAIHEASPRKDGPFIRVNCAAIPENLIESELFGHEKGSFTGAISQRIGKFEQAQNGTIFLDEIGEVPLQTQVKLLRVLQEFEVDRVGGQKPVKVDVRVITATNKNLYEMIQKKTFREDLYYRLNVIPINLPPLRDRMGDIPLLVEFFLEKIALRERSDKKFISSEVLEYLEAYSWPGNIRELENTLIRAATLSEGMHIESDVLPHNITNVKKINGLIRLVDGHLLPIEAYEKEIIKEALRLYGSFNKAGKALGLTHRTVGLKAKKYGLVD